jgi:nucleoside 2-deoxyribosyltransferase
MKIYVAGPLGFSEAGRSFHDKTIVPMLERLGHIVLDPWKLTVGKKIARVSALPYGAAKRRRWAALNQVIGENNARAIARCDLVFGVLDGADVDSGTAAEIGYAFALGKPILGYRGDFRLSADNDGSTVNLQVEYFIRTSGGTIVSSVKDFSAALSQIQRRPKMRTRLRNAR